MPSFILLWLLRQPASLFHEVAGIISSTLLDSMSDLTNQIRKKEKRNQLAMNLWTCVLIA